MKKYKLREDRKQQYKYMLIGAAVCITIMFTAKGAKGALNTVEAYSYEEAESNEDLVQRELMYINAEEDIIPPAYMSMEVMNKIGAKVGDIIDIPGKGKVVVKNILTMRENVVIIPNNEAEINGEDYELFEYRKVNGGN